MWLPPAGPDTRQFHSVDRWILGSLVTPHSPRLRGGCPCDRPACKVQVQLTGSQDWNESQYLKLVMLRTASLSAPKKWRNFWILGNKHLSSYWNPIYEAQNTECWGTRWWDRIYCIAEEWGVPEEVEVGPLEVLVVKGKGEDGAEIVIRSRYSFSKKEWQMLNLSHLTIISVSRIKMKRIRYLTG